MEFTPITNRTDGEEYSIKLDKKKIRVKRVKGGVKKTPSIRTRVGNAKVNKSRVE